MSKYSTLIDATEHANAAAAFLEGAQLAADMLSKHEFRHQPDGQTVRASVNTQSILLRQALGELDVLRSKLHEVAK